MGFLRRKKKPQKQQQQHPKRNPKHVEAPTIHSSSSNTRSLHHPIVSCGVSTSNISAITEVYAAEQDFVAKYSEDRNILSKSGTTHCTGPTVLMNEQELSFSSGLDSRGGGGGRSCSQHSRSLSDGSSSSNNSLFKFSPTLHSDNTTHHSSPTATPVTIHRPSVFNDLPMATATPVEQPPPSLFDEAFDELASVETPLHMRPYVSTEDHQLKKDVQPYVKESSFKGGLLSQKELQQQYEQQQEQSKQQLLQSESYPLSQAELQQQYEQSKQTKQLSQAELQQQYEQSKSKQQQPKQRSNRPTPINQRQTSQRVPQVTAASIPFEKTIAPTSYLHDFLHKDEAYRHAMKNGIVWQSLVGQSVKLPALWYDGMEPATPFLGCPSKSNKWSFFGRHRIGNVTTQENILLQKLVRSEQSSGKLLLHIIVKDSQTFAPTEDIVIGVFHPNAIGIRPTDSTVAHTQRLNNCRDVWIGHRSRSVPTTTLDGKKPQRIATRIESLLRYRNKNRVYKSPLGGKNDLGIPCRVDNTNMNFIYGNNPVRSTIFVPEQKLFKFLSPKNDAQQHSIPEPASITLMKAFIG